MVSYSSSSSTKFKPPRLAYQADPIRDSLKVLGKKWTLLVVRDIALLKLRRFGEIERNNPGLTPRVLSRRLKEMKREGLIETIALDGDSHGYRLTSKGEDAVYILLAILRYGIRHHMQSEKDEADVIKELHYNIATGTSRYRFP